MQTRQTQQLPKIYEVSYIDSDTKELQVYQGNYNQCLEIFEAYKESNEKYNDMIDLQMKLL